MTQSSKNAQEIREDSPDFAEWAAGIGVIKHSDETQERVFYTLQAAGIKLDFALPLLKSADQVCNQAMWLVVHMTYAENINLKGEPLSASDFKQSPQGHTGGSLNMVPAYLGYLTANALTGESREWLMGQGHCVAAVDAVNLLMKNSLPVHEERYPLTNIGLSQLSRDFYSYKITASGQPESPIGSHVNVNTAGASMEGGYLGFAGLHYVHQPLPGEKLVAFLSDGAFEEQRGSDWSARWWREQDCGLVAPILIANGRRIDQRTTGQQLGGTDYFIKHLEGHSFAPNVFDGRDPAAFAINILLQEQNLKAAANRIKEGKAKYPVKLPYGIAETEKGFGFYGEGTNPAHGTPLPANPRFDETSLSLFNLHASKLFVAEDQWRVAVDLLNNHVQTDRPKERDVSRDNQAVVAQVPRVETPEALGESSPTACLDECFVEIVKANPFLRPRVCNPDELSSNRFKFTLDYLKHRVTETEQGVAEAINGAVITALNEEAVISAVLANRKGINIAVSYEAFAPKMLGALRQKIIFSRHRKELYDAAYWLSIPVIVTSHLWENGKNEQSHQDSTFCEAMMAEMADVSRVVFPADGASAIEMMRTCYQSNGQIFTMVVPKASVANQLGRKQAKQVAKFGATRLSGDGSEAIQLIAIGAYQLVEAKKTASRLSENGYQYSLVYIAEPGRFRAARDHWENAFVNEFDDIQSASAIFGSPSYRLLLCHGRPEYFLGVLRPLDLGPSHTQALGYINRGGTLDIEGMFFANSATWAHALAALSAMTGDLNGVLSEAERAAVAGKGDPYDIIAKPYMF